MHIGRDGVDGLDPVIAVDIGGVHETDLHVARAHVFGHVANLLRTGVHLVGDRCVPLVGHRAVIRLRRRRQTGGDEGLQRILAGRNRIGLADGEGIDGVGSEIDQVGDLEVAVRGGSEDQVVIEHVQARGRVDGAVLVRLVHGARRCRDEDIGMGLRLAVGAGELAHERARGFELSIREGNLRMRLGVKLLNFRQGLLQRIGCEDMQLDGIGLRSHIRR